MSTNNYNKKLSETSSHSGLLFSHETISNNITSMTSRHTALVATVGPHKANS